MKMNFKWCFFGKGGGGGGVSNPKYALNFTFCLPEWDWYVPGQVFLPWIDGQGYGPFSRLTQEIFCCHQPSQLL